MSSGNADGIRRSAGHSASGGKSAGRRQENHHNGKTGRSRRVKERKAKQRKRRFLAAALLAVVLLIIVCVVRVARKVSDAVGPEDYTSPTAEFRKDWSIRVTSVESFDEGYYDETELSEMIRNAVDSYNEEKGSTGVTEESFSVADGSAKVVLVYENAADYEAFNNTTLFVGTVEEAENEGFDFTSIMQAVSNEDSSRILTQATLDQLLTNQVIILTEQVNVVIPKKENILYATPNLGVTDFQHATAIDTISDEKPAIVILQ